MYDYLLVYYMLTSAAVPVSAANPTANVLPRTDAWGRVAAVSVQERFGSQEQCRQRIEAIRFRAAQTNVPSERFELDCHPVPRPGAVIPSSAN